MHNYIQKFVLSLLVLVTAIGSQAAELQWFTDLAAAKAKAKKENKCLMLDFTGSDWCGWCKKLKSEVFDTPEFAEFANLNFVMVEVDFPKIKKLSLIQQMANEQLRRQYNIQGFPTLIILDKDGEEMGETGYSAGGPQAFITGLQLRFPGFKNGAPAKGYSPGAIISRMGQNILGTRKEEPAATNAPAAPPAPVAIKYPDVLTLKAISGVKTRRLAMINNQTLMVGETAKVKVQDRQVEVACKEIRDDSVLILADGHSLELKLTVH